MIRRPVYHAAEAARGAAPHPAAAAISLVEAMSIARRSIAVFTEQKVDAVSSCSRSAEGWSIEIDVLESPARLGDNDLLATFEVSLDLAGEVTGFTRLRRYHREDKDDAR